MTAESIGRQRPRRRVAGTRAGRKQSPLSRHKPQQTFHTPPRIPSPVHKSPPTRSQVSPASPHRGRPCHWLWILRPRSVILARHYGKVALRSNAHSGLPSPRRRRDVFAVFATPVQSTIMTSTAVRVFLFPYTTHTKHVQHLVSPFSLVIEPHIWRGVNYLHW